jgi:streptomycin 6-kinase
MISFPASFARTVTTTFEGGAAWLERLPALLDECARRWSLTLLPPFELSYNYVAPAVRSDGTEVVLKAGVPNRELWTEMEMLRLCDGRGMVRLLEADEDLGAMVLERLQPGTMLVTVTDDEQATAIAAEVMRALWRPAPEEHPFPSVVGWATGLGRLRQTFGGSGPFPEPLVAMAERLFGELLGSMAEPVVLHGDLHHYNILAATRAPWLAIDPKGVVGEPAYECGALLRNPVPHFMDGPDPGGMLARRVDQLAEALGFERERIAAWGVAQAVLSAWWSYEDHAVLELRMLQSARLLARRIVPNLDF